LHQALADVVPQYAQRVDGLTEELGRALERRLRLEVQRCDALVKELPRCLKNRLRNEELKTDGLLRRMEALSPLAVLRRGYSVTTAGDGVVVKRAQDVKTGARLTTRLADGNLISEVLEVGE